MCCVPADGTAPAQTEADTADAPPAAQAALLAAPDEAGGGAGVQPDRGDPLVATVGWLHIAAFLPHWGPNGGAARAEAVLPLAAQGVPPRCLVGPAGVATLPALHLHGVHIPGSPMHPIPRVRSTDMSPSSRPVGAASAARRNALGDSRVCSLTGLAASDGWGRLAAASSLPLVPTAQPRLLVRCAACTVMVHPVAAADRSPGLSHNWEASGCLPRRDWRPEPREVALNSKWWAGGFESAQRQLRSLQALPRTTSSSDAAPPLRFSDAEFWKCDDPVQPEVANAAADAELADEWFKDRQQWVLRTPRANAGKADVASTERPDRAHSAASATAAGGAPDAASEAGQVQAAEYAEALAAAASPWPWPQGPLGF